MNLLTKLIEFPFIRVCSACCGYALDVVRLFLWIANQFVFLGKSICFPWQINLNSSAIQFEFLSKSIYFAEKSDVYCGAKC